MASKQTRRSISVRGTTYSMLRDFCAEHDRSMSDVVEELLGRILESDAPAKKTIAPLVARAPQAPNKPVQPHVKAFEKADVEAKPEPRKVEDRAAVRVDPRPAPVAPPPKAVAAPKAPAHPGPARPVPVQNAGRPAPTPASKVEGTTRSKPGNGDYRAIRF